MKKRVISLFLSAAVLSAFPFYIPVSAASVLELSARTATLGVGEEYFFFAETDSTKKISWSSSEKTVATVRGDGRVKARSAGKTTITVKTDGLSAEIRLTVKDEPIRVKADNLTVTAKFSEKIKVRLPSGSASKGRTFASSNEKIAQVDENGTVTGKKAGKCTVTVTTYNNLTATAEITVEPFPKTVTIKGKEYETALTELSLSWKDLTSEDIAPLKFMTKLTKLDLSCNRISDVGAIKGLTKLRELNLSDNMIRKIAPLADLTNLRVLNLSNNDIGGLSPLRGLVKLSELKINGNNVRSVVSLKNMVNLKTLELEDNEIKSVSGLKGLSRLRTLNLNFNKIKGISALNGLSRLRDLRLFDNNISASEINGMRKSVPKCKVIA
ncbi:MAG: leucine-rich repeat domain-containing protein [Oscillospiraceae bacterium]|jgi:Leucine-rich repeat (LRR) protein|nr:leucine-rich repeat domain-containing protein [Oscillospiraceae bacterium]